MELLLLLGFPGVSDSKESACNAGDPGSIPGVRKVPCRREWLPTPVFLPGEFQGQRSLAGYDPWGHKELDTTNTFTVDVHVRLFATLWSLLKLMSIESMVPLNFF